MLGARRCALDRRDEAVPAPGDVGHITIAALTVAQGLPQLRDVEAQAALIDRYVGPGIGHQLALADDFAGAADQEREKVECPTAKRDRFAVALQTTLVRNNAEGPEGNDFRDCFGLYRRAWYAAGRHKSPVRWHEASYTKVPLPIHAVIARRRVESAAR